MYFNLTIKELKTSISYSHFSWWGHILPHVAFYVLIPKVAF